VKNYRLEISGGFSLNLQRVNNCSRNLLFILCWRLAPFWFDDVKIYTAGISNKGYVGATGLAVGGMDKYVL
jgi:hypothetical protein